MPSAFQTAYQSKSKMLEDVRLLLGLSREELVSTLTLLEKADYGSLQFARGRTGIRFQSFPSTHSVYSDVSVEIESAGEGVKQTVEYQIPRSVLKLFRRAKKDKVQDGLNSKAVKV